MVSMRNSRFRKEVLGDAHGVVDRSSRAYQDIRSTENSTLLCELFGGSVDCAAALQRLIWGVVGEVVENQSL